MRLLSEKGIDLSDYYKSLYDCMVTDDVKGLLLLTRRIWNLPVSIIDMHYNLVDMQPRTPIGDPTYDVIADLGEITPEMVKSFLDGKYMATVMGMEKPCVVDWGITTSNNRLTYRLSEQNRLYGAISFVLLEGYAWTEEDTEVLRPIAAACAHALASRNAATSVKSSVERWLLTTLLEQGYLDESSMERVYKRFCYCEQSQFQLVRLSDGLGASPYHQDYLERRLRFGFPDQFCCYISGGLYLLLQHVRSAGLAEQRERLGEFMRSESHAVFGVSRPFDNLNKIAIYRRQADFAFESALKKQLTGMQYYEDYTLEHIFSVLSEHLPAESCGSEVARRLAEYDSLNGTAYLSTLKAYLYSFLDNKRTVEYFGIHRNTLFYRLRQIELLTGLDFQRSDELLKVLLSLRIQDFRARAEGGTPHGGQEPQ